MEKGGDKINLSESSWGEDKIAMHTIAQLQRGAGKI